MMATKIGSRNIAFLFTFLCLMTLTVNIASAEPYRWSNSVPVSTSSAAGTIDREIFLRSIPSLMVVGQTYRVIVVVTNTGNEPTNFFVDLTYPFRYTLKYFFSQQVWDLPMMLTLDPGVSQRMEFAITPLVEDRGALEIEARIYLADPHGSEPIDSVSATVREIRTALPIDLLWWGIGFMLLAVFFFLAARLLRSPSGKLDLLITLLLFAVAFLLRGLSATTSSLNRDEAGFWMGSYIFLNNNWMWPRVYMMSGYPPLFQYLLAGITFLFGSSLITVRTISIISGSLTVVVSYFLAKSLLGRKVGLTSALLLCFSNYHILYSGTAMTDALTLLLILLSVYFFWIGWQRNISKYLVLSGFFLGLAFDVKYVAILVIPAIFLFVVWTRKSFRSLLERRILAWIVLFLGTIFPVQLTLLVNGINPLGSYLRLTFGPRGLPMQSVYPIQELIPRGFRTFMYPLARAASPWLPWLIVFETAIYILLFVTIIYHIRLTLKGQPSESFVLIFMLAALSLLIDPVKHPHWLLYSFPFFFIMLSNMVFRYAHDLIIRVSRSQLRDISTGMYAVDFFKIFILLFACILMFSNIFVGMATPFIDQGEFVSVRSSMLFIKNRVHPNDTIVGFHNSEIIFYYINLYNLNVPYISLIKYETPLFKEFSWTQMKLNEQLLRTSKPRFIIENKMYFDYYYNLVIKGWIFENYDLVFSSWPSIGYRWLPAMGYQNWLVLEIKD